MMFNGDNIIISNSQGLLLALQELKSEQCFSHSTFRVKMKQEVQCIVERMKNARFGLHDACLSSMIVIYEMTSMTVMLA